jgi:hypothetical protein
MRIIGVSSTQGVAVGEGVRVGADVGVGREAWVAVGDAIGVWVGDAVVATGVGSGLGVETHCEKMATIPAATATRASAYSTPLGRVFIENTPFGPTARGANGIYGDGWYMYSIKRTS